MRSCSRALRHQTVSFATQALFSRLLLRRTFNIVAPFTILLASALLLMAGSAADPHANAVPPQPQKLPNYAKLPLSFEPNQGQTDNAVRYISRGTGYTLFLTPTEAVFSLQQGKSGTKIPSAYSTIGKTGQAPSERPQDTVLRVRLVNPSNTAAITALDQLPGQSNYFRGNDPTRWVKHVPTYARLQYSGIFPGVDLVYYGNQGQLEYDFVVSPEADSRSIRMNFTGARALRIDRPTGDLVMTVGKEEVRFHKPIAYQTESPDSSSTHNSKHFVAAEYQIHASNHVSFAVGSYDHTRNLVIDPTLSYSTYLGGSNNDYGTALAVDSSGSAYLTGYTGSTNFPVTPDAFQVTCGGGCAGSTYDAFVTKLDPTGSYLVYSTYLGGSGDDYGQGIALDASGDAYIVGQTLSANFPVTPGAFQPQCGGGSGKTCPGGDIFITELNPEGNGLVYSTYLGGSGVDQGNAIALDANNDAYVTGFTQSTNFPVTLGAFQTTCKCTTRSVAFVTELNSTGTALVYSTYLGGSFSDVGYAIALDSSDDAYLTGYTHSSNFPTTPGAFQTTLNADTAAWVTKMNSTGTALVYSTYLGGDTTATTQCEACGTSIAVDSSGNAYVCGLTAEQNFPTTPGAYQTTFMGNTNGHDAFITKLNSGGSALVFSTYLGGNGDTGATTLSVDSLDNVWVRGNTKSTSFPITPGAFQLANAGAYDVFVSELNSAGSELLYSTYLGGSGTEYGGATRLIALDQNVPPGVYVTGYTNSTNYPVSEGAIQTTPGGNNDSFVTKFAPSPNVGLSPALNFGYQTDGTTSAPQTVTLMNTGNTNLTVSSVMIVGANAADFAETNSCGTIPPQGTCPINVTFTPSIIGSESADLSVTDNAPGSPQQVSLTGYGVGSGPTAVLSPTRLGFATQLVGTSSPSQKVTLTNAGSTALIITSVKITGDFSQTNNCGSSLAAGLTCTINVTFKPTAPNTRTGTITLIDNATGSPQTVALTGVGTYVRLTPGTLAFGAITVGDSSPAMKATFSNTASFSLAVTISITGTNASEYSQTNTCGSSVPANSNCTISVVFSPTAKGGALASLSVADSGGASPQLVSLQGTGQ
ncbi:MAG: SBBP repeat-containing protein [Candidatus Sulfotelmatobacter sp.]